MQEKRQRMAGLPEIDSKGRFLVKIYFYEMCI